jgi:hypothetical protein
MVISPDLKAQIDGSVQKHILAHLPELPIDLVPVSWFPTFKFVLPQTTRYVLIDFMEPHAPSEEYDKFWAWVKENPPILTFRRELDKRSVSPVVKPIEWACYLTPPERSEHAQYDARPIDVLFLWGYSHAQRPKLHGDIFREGLTKYGINVIDQWDKWNGKKCWLTIYAPYWKRIPMPEIIGLMQQAKITVAMPGNGKKTFRHAECVGTLMAMQRDSLAWAYPWDDTNSIGLVQEMDFYSLLKATERTDLYDIYNSCCVNMSKYSAETYTRDYVLKAIESVL